LDVDFKEDGSAAGGYAKEMSKEWHEAAERMLLKECATTNVIITTALIPGFERKERKRKKEREREEKERKEKERKKEREERKQEKTRI